MSHNLTTALVEDLRGRTAEGRIVEGRIAPGERLPSASSLDTGHGVSRRVVRQTVRTGVSGDARERG